MAGIKDYLFDNPHGWLKGYGPMSTYNETDIANAVAALLRRAASHGAQ